MGEVGGVRLRVGVVVPPGEPCPERVTPSPTLPHQGGGGLLVAANTLVTRRLDRRVHGAVRRRRLRDGFAGRAGE